MENSIDQNSNIEEPISQFNQLNLASLLEVVIRRKKIFILLSLGFFLIGSTNILYKRIKNPIYRGSFTLMISDPFINEAQSNIESLALNRASLDIPTLIQYLKSPGVLSSIAKKNNISPTSLSNRINISVGQNIGGLSRYLSKTLTISLEGKNKYDMQNILKDLSRQYVINASEARNEKLSEGIKFLNNEKPKLLAKVKEAQMKLEKFRLDNRIINPIQKGENVRSLIDTNQNKIMSLNSENLRLNFIKDNLLNGILYTKGISGSKNSTDSANLGITGSDQLLLDEILKLKADISRAQSKYKESSIVIQNLKNKLNQLEPILLENQKLSVAAAITVNNSLIKAYENQLLELKKNFISIPAKITEYSTIEQELKSLETNLSTLNKTKDKLELDLSQGVLPWKIIREPFVNPSPIKPEVKKNLIYLLLYTFAFASLITFILEKLDDVFHNPKEVEKFINIPTLGFVPFFNFEENPNSDVIDKGYKRDKGLITINDCLEIDKKENLKSMKFIFEETFRNIYTSIKFSKSDKFIKIINITSTIPEEGKSLCSLFLAMNVAQIAKKILLIDLDLRKPALHKRLQVDNVTGISNFLVNSDSDWNKYINVHPSIEKLHYLTSGKIPPNPIALLESEKMRTFLEELRKSNEYDLIILDCPPLLGLSDSLIISDYVDASILTVSLNKVNKKLAVDCLQKIKQANKPIIGTIINSIYKEAERNFFNNGYYSYANQYNYYSYKYMPQETQNRYQDKDNEFKKDKEKSEKLFKGKSFIERGKTILNKFIKWINE